MTLFQFKFQLQKIDFHAEPEVFTCSGATNEMAVKRLIVAKETQGCGDNSNEIIRADLDIPPIPPTDSTSSSVVKVTYYLRVGEHLIFQLLNLCRQFILEKYIIDKCNIGSLLQKSSS